LSINESLFDPNGWRKLSQGKLTCVIGHLDNLLRWDLCALLNPLPSSTIQSHGILTVGAKLLCDISLDEFCDNLVCSIPERGFTNAGGKVLNATKRSELTKTLQNFQSAPSLCLSFIYGGFPQEATHEYTWTDDNNTFLILDKTNPGVEEMFSASTKDIFDRFTQSTTTHLPNKSPESPKILLQKYIQKEEKVVKEGEHLVQRFKQKEDLTPEEWNKLGTSRLLNKEELFSILNEQLKTFGKSIAKKTKKGEGIQFFLKENQKRRRQEEQAREKRQARQDKTKQDRTGQDRTRHDMT